MRCCLFMKVVRVFATALSFVFLVLQFASTLPNISGAPLRYADVSGTWDLKVETSGGTGTPTIILAQEGEKITGTYRGRLGESSLDGTIKGNEIAFSVNVKFENQVLTVVYKGSVDKDSMKGTVRFGDRGTGNWTGRRKTSS